MCNVNIKNIEKLISDNLGPEKIIKNIKSSNLNDLGENYLSYVLKIDVHLQDKVNNTEEDLHLVTKCVINDDKQPNVGDMTAQLMKQEILCYQEIIPSIKSFQTKYGLPELEFFTECFGTSYAAHNDVIADKDAIIILENLQSIGYINVDRHVGFNLDESKSILNDLAMFHAVPLAIRILDPALFEAKIKKNIIPRPNPPGNHKTGPPSQLKIYRKMLELDKEFTDFSKYDAYVKTEIERFSADDLQMKPVGPFTTFIHSDMWLNNTMHIIENGKIVKNKFLDFQLCSVGSPVCDLLFFLISSVKMQHLSTNFDNLIQFYYEHLVQHLKEFKCYSENLNYDNFLIEMKTAVTQVLMQCMYMTANVIFYPRGKMFDHSTAHEVKMEDVHPVAREKIGFLMKEAVKRNWI